MKTNDFICGVIEGTSLSARIIDADRLFQVITVDRGRVINARHSSNSSFLPRESSQMIDVL